MIAPLAKPGRITSGEYIAWALEQTSGRYELVEGEVVAMAPERISHARAKLRIARQLEDAIEAAGLPCEAFTNGMAVEIDQHTVYEPDAMVRCGEPLPGEAVVVTDPLIVVEVLSPSTRALDTSIKLDQYFRIPSLQHYLIVRTTSPAIIHHRRTAGGGIEMQLVQGGELRLEPPGIVIKAPG